MKSLCLDPVPMDVLTVIRYKAEIEDALEKNLNTVLFSFRSRRVREELLVELDEWLMHHDLGVRLYTEVRGSNETYLLIVHTYGSAK